MRPHAYLHALHRRGLTPGEAHQHCLDYGMAPDPNIPAAPSRAAMGRPRVRFDWHRAQMHFAAAIVKAADGIAGRQFKTEVDRQKVFAVRDRFMKILSELQRQG